MMLVRYYAGGKAAGIAGIADTYFLRLRGLIGRSAKDMGGLVIRPCNQVHSCFMKETIDVVYIDGDGVVLKVDEGLAPWRFRPIVKGSKQVLELENGGARKQGIVPGVKMRFGK